MLINPNLNFKVTKFSKIFYFHFVKGAYCGQCGQNGKLDNMQN